MKNFLGINWKVRFNNPTAIGQLLISIFLPVLIFLGVDWQTLTSWAAVGQAILQIISNPIAVVLILVNFYNATVDGTSTGLADSTQAQRYNKPNKQ